MVHRLISGLLHRKRTLSVIVFSGFIFLPYALYAQGLVTCDGVAIQCQLCHLAEMGQRIINFLIINLGVPTAMLLFTYAGYLYVTYAASPDNLDKAKKIFTSVLLGFMFMLVSWLLVDTIMKALVDQSSWGPWNQIRCVAQPVQGTGGIAGGTLIPVPGGTATPIVAGNTSNIAMWPEEQARLMSDSAITSILNRINPAYLNVLQQVSNETGVPYDRLVAICVAESSCQMSATSPVGAAGSFQLMPGTARSLDSSLSGLTDDQIRARLNNDFEYSARLGATYYASFLNQYSDYTVASAAYNGGNASLTGATGASQDCPGLQRWQCLWDSPGCYNTSNTNCQRNVVGNAQNYGQTRIYVSNINNIQKKVVAR